MSEKKDIKDLKEVVIFGFKVLEFGKGIFPGGKFTIAALLNFPALVALYQPAIAAFDNIGDVVPEALDLDESEMAELAALVVSMGGLSEHASAIVAQSIRAAMDARQAVISIGSLIKAVKA